MNVLFKSQGALVEAVLAGLFKAHDGGTDLYLSPRSVHALVDYLAERDAALLEMWLTLFPQDRVTAAFRALDKDAP